MPDAPSNSKPRKRSDVFKELVLIVGIALLFEVQWALLGTVLGPALGINGMRWAMIGLWVFPTLICIPYFRFRGRTWPQAIGFAFALGLVISTAMFLMTLAAFGSMP